MRALLTALAVSTLALPGTLALSALAQGPNPFAGEADAIAAGAAIYQTTCAACHGADGAGTAGGPPLNRPLARAQDDAALFAIIHDGIADTKMPAFPALSEENIWRLAAHVRSLNALAPVPLAAMADARAGERLFFGEGGCAACHEVNGRGGALASDLSAVGRKPAIAIRNALAHEPLPMRFVQAVTAQGQRIGGFVQAEDLFTLHLRQADGTLRMLAKAALRSVAEAENPLALPLLEERQRDDIIAYLSGLKARDLAETAKQTPAPLLPHARIAAPELRNWVTPRGALDGGNFSTLSGITPANVAQLQARWSASLGDGGNGAAPLVVDGLLYAAGAPGHAAVFDAQNGLPVWRFAPPVSGDAAMAGGIALLDGRVFTAAADGRLIALNAHTGRALWETTPPGDGTMLGAPLALPGRIVIGVTGDGAKAQGRLEALDPASGEKTWRLVTTAARMTGAMSGAVGAYAPQTDTLYWSTTRSTDDGPDGDSILAVKAQDGTVTWRHKLAPGAGGDGVVLADQSDGGTRRALLLHLGRDGLLTILDRASGKPLRTQSLRKTRVETPSLSFDRSSFVAYAALGDAVAAVDARNGRVLWRANLAGPVVGVLATRGGVVFATLADGQMMALAGGKPLWHFRAGGPITGAPISYLAGGRQFIAVTAGNMVHAFALPN